MMKCLIWIVLSFGWVNCAGTIDTFYWVSKDKTFRKSVEERENSGKTIRRQEFELEARGQDAWQLQCFDRTRSLERVHHVSKTFEYQNGYSPDAYRAAALVDGLALGVAGATIGIVCSDGDSSCSNLAYLIPLALDLGYGVWRSTQVDKPVLIDKERFSGRVQVSDYTIESAALTCSEESKLVLGMEHISNATLDGPNSLEQREIDYETSIPLPLDANHQLLLSWESIQFWLEHPGALLWVVDPTGQSHHLRVDRCAMLRPYRMDWSLRERNQFDKECPLPESNPLSQSAR